MVVDRKTTMEPSSQGGSPLCVSLISLKESDGRRKYFASGWDKHVGKGKTLFGAHCHQHIVDRDPEGGLLGCTRSHMACYKRAVEEFPRAEACLVFEDDVRPNFRLTRELLNECLELIRAGWDVIRLHKTGICKVHGKVSDKFYHASSFCGRAYLISRSLMEETLKYDAKEIVPYTSFLARRSSRHLTYWLPAIEEGAFGSANEGGGFGRGDPLVSFLQWSLNYTTLVENSVANAQFYLHLASPLYNEQSFPHADQFWRAYEAENDRTGELPFAHTMQHYRLHVGEYNSALTRSVMMRSLVVRSLTSDSRTGEDITGLYCKSKLASTNTNDFDVIIIGAGIVGSSSAYWLRKLGKRVLLLEEHAQDEDLRNRGSSGNGPRRVGLLELAPGARVKQAWDLWMAIQKEADRKLLDVTGEVIVVNIFPLGWVLWAVFALWSLFRAVANLVAPDSHCLPESLKLLFTKKAVESKLPACFEGKLSWNQFGVHYEEAATLRADDICQYLREKHANEDNLTGARVVKIEAANSKGTVTVEVANQTKSFSADFVVLSAGEGTAAILRDSFDIQCRNDVDTFVCPAFDEKVPGQSFDQAGLRPGSCPAFAFPGESVYGFPVVGDNGKFYIRSMIPEATGEHGHQELSIPLADSEDACRVRSFAKRYVGSDTLADKETHKLCRYVRLKVGNSKGAQRIVDFVPKSHGKVVAVSGLDGCGFKYGSLFGKEVHELLYGSGRAPAGMEWPPADGEGQAKAEGTALTCLHYCIDGLLKMSGAGGDAGGSFAFAKIMLAVSVLLGSSLGESSLRLVGEVLPLQTVQKALHIGLALLSVSYSLGCEFRHRPRKAGMPLLTWCKEVAFVWGIHFTWGLVLPLVLALILDCMFATVVSREMSVLLLLCSFALGAHALLIRSSAMEELRQHNASYDRQVNIPGADTSLLKGDAAKSSEATRVISSGVYAISRHPGFAAHVIQLCGLALWVSASWWLAPASTAASTLRCPMVVFAVCAIVAMIVFDDSGKAEEEQFLANNEEIAKAYAEYLERVPGRLNVLSLLSEVSMSDALMGWTQSVREGGSSSRRAFLALCGWVAGVRVEYLDMRQQGDVKLLEKILLSGNKGLFVEDKLACPAWSPVRSVESVTHAESAPMRRKVRALLDAISPTEEEFQEAVRRGMERELERVRRGEQTFDARSVAAATVQTFMWLLTRNDMSQEDVDLALRATEEWKATICMKQPPGSKKDSLKDEYLAMVRRNVRESEFWQEALRTMREKSDMCKQELDVESSISDLSCIVQPLLISPAINVPDLMASFKMILTDFHPEMISKAQASVDFCECLTMEIVRTQHPFPILERVVARDIVGEERTLKKGTHMFVEMDQFSSHCAKEEFRDFDPESRWSEYISLGQKAEFGTPGWRDMVDRCPYVAMPFGAGPRRCAGQAWARQVLKHQIHLIVNTFHREQESRGQSELSWSDHFQPSRNHRFSGRTNDGNESDENLPYILGRLASCLAEFFTDRVKGVLTFGL